jgi:hypothetical protein
VRPPGLGGRKACSGRLLVTARWHHRRLLLRQRARNDVTEMDKPELAADFVNLFLI